MKNLIVRFLRDESGDGLNDLFLLAVLVATAAVIAIAIGIAGVIVIGLIVLLIKYVLYLCKLWREGKRGWVWAGLIPLVVMTIILGMKVIEVGSNFFIEQQRIQKEKLNWIEQDKIAAQLWRDTRDYAANLPLTGHLKLREPFGESKDKTYVLTIEPDNRYLELWKRYEPMSKYHCEPISKDQCRDRKDFNLQCGYVTVENPENWKFNRKTLHNFLASDTISFDTYGADIIGLYFLSSPFEIEIYLKDRNPGFDEILPPDLLEVCLMIEWHDSPSCRNPYFGIQLTKTRIICATLQQ